MHTEEPASQGDEMNDETRLLEKLRRIEALHAGATTDGERSAAADARRRIEERLSQLKATDVAIEFRYTMRNVWSKRLLLALLRRYGLRPYRYYRQHDTTVMVRIPRSFEAMLWAEFLALDEALQAHLDAVAERVIAEAMASDTSDAEEVRGELAAGFETHDA